MRTLLLAVLLASQSSGYQVDSFHGEVRFERREAEMQSVAGLGQSLSAGDRLVLAANAGVVLRKAGEQVIAAGPGELEVGPQQLRWRGRELLLSGSEASNQIVLDDGLVQFSGGLIRVRQSGQAYFVEALAGGAAGFVGKHGYTAVQAGEGLRIQGQQAVAAKLLRAPKPVFPRPHQAMNAFRFRWQPLKGAEAYRLEVAGDPYFSQLVYAGDVTLPVYAEAARSLPIGLLFWRVTAKQAGGFWGIPSEPQPVRIAP